MAGNLKLSLLPVLVHDISALFIMVSMCVCSREMGDELMKGCMGGDKGMVGDPGR